MRFSVHVGILAVVLALSGFGCALAASGDDLARDYLIQHVCVDPAGKVLPVDPYDCSPPDRLRPLDAGETLPYYKHDQPRAGKPLGYLRYDTYPARDPAGREIIVNPAIFPPFDRYEPGARDGYNTFLVRDGWAAIGDTKDGGGFSTTFYGAGCAQFAGWVLFPTSMFRGPEPASGRALVPIAANYWEQNGQSWPGSCPQRYDPNSLTTWEFIKGFTFAGVGDNRVKTIDTIRSVHGFRPDPGFQAHGHLEVFYFTKVYGFTRWEAWATRAAVSQDVNLQGQAARVRPSCSGAPEMSYEQTDFVRIDCRDWSAVTIQDPPRAPPVWPIPELNLIKNFHFGEGTAGWVLTGQSREGAGVSGRLLNSSSMADRKFTQPGGSGVRYLALDCAGTCADDETLYQDVPIDRGTASGSYYVGMTTRFESGGSTGAMAASVEQIDGAGKIIDGTHQDVFDIAVPAVNQFAQKDDSLLRSSSFLGQDLTLRIRPETTALRVAFSPRSAGVFDIFDIWLMAKP